MFHPVCGRRIILFNNYKTARRSSDEFDNGVVFSREPLKKNHLFEIKVQKKIYSWSGGLQLGVTKCNPISAQFPSQLSDLKNDTWVLRGNTLLKDNDLLLDIYGLNLDHLNEGDVVGIMVTDQNELLFTFNGVNKGIAAFNIPCGVFVVIDLYGQIIETSIVSYALVENLNFSTTSFELDPLEEFEIAEGNSVLSNIVTNFDHQTTLPPQSDTDMSPVNSASDIDFDIEPMRFHPRCGLLARISPDGRAAERLRPFEEFNNSIVVTHRPLQTNELFEIRIDRLVEKWSGSIEVGITMHNPNYLQFPHTMTNLKSGTIMMSGGGILTNGKAAKRDYGDYNLDELKIGDRIALLRKPSGDLHYFINEVDQGVAASNVPLLSWGVVDLYGRIVKVSIYDRKICRDYMITRKMSLMHGSYLLHCLVEIPEADSHGLLFHRKCGHHVAVFNGRRSAYRPNALEDFNNGVVLTDRPLRINEPFEVRLDRIVSRWAGSIEIGVTSFSPAELEFPSTMTNIRNGTWMMTGNGVMHNGTTILDDYGINLDRLQTGDRVAVLIKDSGMLHLYVNGIDQGEVNANINCPMYGVIDLYGQAAQATILEYDLFYTFMPPSETLLPFPFTGPLDLCFHFNHSKNIRICNNGRTAMRPQPMAEFTDAIVLGNRLLQTDEMFSISVDKIIEHWSSTMEPGKFHLFKLGVTTVNIDELELPVTMSDLDHSTWMLSGQDVTKDGLVIKYDYDLNLNDVKVGSIIGMMRHTDHSLHYYLNDIDVGEACNYVPENIYPIIDLYGQCVEISIVNPPLYHVEESFVSNETSFYQSTSNWHEDLLCSMPSNQTLFEGPLKNFNQLCGKHITFSEDLTVATRSSHHNYGLLLSNFILEQDKLFEVTITKWNGKYAGSMSIGVATLNPDKFPLPANISFLKPDVWYLSGDEVWHNGRVIKTHYGHNLHWLQYGSTIGVKYCSDGTLRFYVNGCDQGVAASDVTGDLYAVVDLYGSATEVTINREVKDVMTSSMLLSVNVQESSVSPSSSATQETLLAARDKLDDLKAERAIMEYNLRKNFDKEKSVKFLHNLISAKEWSFFQELRGRNIKLLNKAKTAVRVESYNQGVVIASKPLQREVLFEVTIDRLNSRWVSSLIIGILCSPLMRSSVPVTAFGFKKDVWLIAGDNVYHNGNKIKSRYGCNLDLLNENQKVGIMVDSDHHLKLYIDEICQGIAANNIPSVCYVVLDLYGQCEQVSMANAETTTEPRPNPIPVAIPSPIPSSSVCSIATAEPVNCEKADLERHEKESPSADISTLSILRPDQDESSISRIKLNKTNENNAVAANYGSESDLKMNKTNENNAVLASSSNNSSMIDSAEFHPKANKTESNSVIASCSMVDFRAQHVLTSLSSSSSTSSVNVSEECDGVAKSTRKSLSISEHSALQPAEHYGDLMRHMSSNNCDHKTSLDLVNTRYQAEKSPRKSKNKNRISSPLNDRPIKHNPHCEYRLQCYRFRDFLGLPAAFFGSDSSVMCYCSSCCPYIVHEMKGDPPSSYSLPNGWCKFPLKKHLMTNNVDAVTLEKWHVAFAGVSVGNVRKILDSGQLIPPNKLKIGFASSEENKSKDNDNDKCHIILSPIIKYATNIEFASHYEYIDQKTKTSYSCCAAFQVLVRPGSYKVGPSSLKMPSKVADIGFNTNTIEWVIKEKESTVLSSLLFKIENS